MHESRDPRWSSIRCVLLLLGIVVPLASPGDETRVGRMEVEAFVDEEVTTSGMVARLRSRLPAKLGSSINIIFEQGEEKSFSLEFEGGTVRDLVKLVNQVDSSHSWLLSDGVVVVQSREHPLLRREVVGVRFEDDFVLKALGIVGESIAPAEDGRAKIVFGFELKTDDTDTSFSFGHVQALVGLVD